MKITDKQVIKTAGYFLARIETEFYRGFFGGNCNHVIALQNKEGETLHLSGKPFYPIGRAGAYSFLISTGDINAPSFTFQKVVH